MQHAIVLIAVEKNGLWNGQVMHDGTVPAASVIHALKGMLDEITKHGLSPVRKTIEEYDGIPRHEEG